MLLANPGHVTLGGGGILIAAVLLIRALPYIQAPDFWKLPHLILNKGLECGRERAAMRTPVSTLSAALKSPIQMAANMISAMVNILW